MPMELDCPKCAFTPLEAKTVRGLALDECPKCRGCWYDLEELSASVQAPERLDAALAKGPLRPRAGSAVCPRCHETMTNGGLVSELLRVDQCEACRGFWLDAHELAVLEKLLVELGR